MPECIGWQHYLNNKVAGRILLPAARPLVCLSKGKAPVWFFTTFIPRGMGFPGNRFAYRETRDDKCSRRFKRIQYDHLRILKPDSEKIIFTYYF